MGGSVEDKTMYDNVGLLRGGLTFYALDSTDPAKLKAILADIERRARHPLREALRSTLVVGMALGMTSYEPVVNIEKLSALYDHLSIDCRPNFIYMTLPGSLLDQFAGPRGLSPGRAAARRRSTTAGRHSGPLTRGSLIRLPSPASISIMVRRDLSRRRGHRNGMEPGGVHAREGRAGRDKRTLLLPKAWPGAALWTKQDFEESLGKCEALGIKIVIDERPQPSTCPPPEDAAQDRVFLAFGSGRGHRHAEIETLRRAGYPIAVVDLPSRTPLSRYMQFVHYAVFGIAYLRDMNFVTQPSVELYKSIASEIYGSRQRDGHNPRASAWRSMMRLAAAGTWRRRLTVFCDGRRCDAAGDDAVEDVRIDAGSSL